MTMEIQSLNSLLLRTISPETRDVVRMLIERCEDAERRAEHYRVLWAEECSRRELGEIDGPTDGTGKGCTG